MTEIPPELRALAEDALPEWELQDARFWPIGISENVSFRVDSSGKRYVLRIHRPGYHTLDELESEQVWTAALADAGIDVPVPVRTRDGRGYVTLPFEGGERHIGMLEWVDGEILHYLIRRNPSDLARHFRAVGRIAAAIHNQSSRWTVPHGFRRHRLDLDGLLGDNAFWGQFWRLPQMSKAQREVIGSARRTIAQELSSLGHGSETFSLIHAGSAYRQPGGGRAGLACHRLRRCRLRLASLRNRRRPASPLWRGPIRRHPGGPGGRIPRGASAG